MSSSILTFAYTLHSFFFFSKNAKTVNTTDEQNHLFNTNYNLCKNDSSRTSIKS